MPNAQAFPAIPTRRKPGPLQSRSAQKWPIRSANRALETPETCRMFLIQLEITQEEAPLHRVFDPFVRFSTVESEYSAHAKALRWRPFGASGECQYRSTHGHLV